MKSSNLYCTDQWGETKLVFIMERIDQDLLRGKKPGQGCQVTKHSHHMQEVVATVITQVADECALHVSHTTLLQAPKDKINVLHLSM